VTGPLGILAWVAGFARDAGEALRPGQWVMTGSIIPTKFAVAGDTYSFQLSSLSPVTVTID
jgi:2-keto-4-pentenoate hydratase